MQAYPGGMKWLIAIALVESSFALTVLGQQPSASPTPSTSSSTTPTPSPAADQSTQGAPQAGSLPTPSQGEAQATGEAPQASPATDTPGTATSSAMDYLFNHRPQQGSVAKEGMEADQRAKTEAMARDVTGGLVIDDPNLKARFDVYLGMNEVPQDQLKSYADDMNTVIDLLHQRKTTQAWQKLYQLATYQRIDSGVSWELANRIESIWNANNTKYQIAQQNNQLQQQSDTDNRNADMDSQDVQEKELEYQRRLNEKTGPAGTSSQNQIPNPGTAAQGTEASPGEAVTAPISDQLLGKLQLTQEYLDSLSAQAKIKINELKVEKLFDQSKQDFADYITTLYKSGRYQHVLIAADFWRQIFDEGDYPVSMAQEVNASLEVEGQVNTTISVFNNNVDQKNIAAATGCLQQAFTLSEFSPEVLGLPLARKKPIQLFSQELGRMQNMIEARDFSDLEVLLNQIKGSAPDFDSVKAISIVDAVKLESELNLGKAKLAAQQGDLKAAMEDFQAAAESWPGNPDLKDKALNFFSSEDDKNQSIEEFDRLVAENNYWAIFDKQLMFAPAMKDDLKRQDELKDALGKVKIAQTALAQSNLLESNGDIDGAWETIQLAIKDLPDDIKLNEMRGDLAGKGADFVSAINKAQDAEKMQELGYSLSWYAIAQRAYPASQIANQGIDRLTKSILDKSGI